MDAQATGRRNKYLTCVDDLTKECLNDHGFNDISHARKIISEWRQDYNECHPHSALNYHAPSEFAAG